MLLMALFAAVAPVMLDDNLLSDLPVEEAELNVHGTISHCSGPSLRSLLTKLGQPEGAAVHGNVLTTIITVTGADGYAVALSLGEVEPTLGHAHAIIATRCEGRALPPETGPYRLVIPGEDRPVRSVRQMQSITITDAVEHDVG